jgi:hypothetical protein
MRQRDFDELFFFVGASEKDIERFVAKAAQKKWQLRQHGMLWSLASGASLKRSIQSLARLYDRALRYHPAITGLAAREEEEFFAACDRSIVLAETKTAEPGVHGPRPKRFELRDPDVWTQILESLTSMS